VRAGKSSASVQPGAGNDSSPASASPNRLSTVTNDGAGCPLTSSNEWRTAASAPNGSTYWYCRKPPGPYTRFQFLIPSSGWKNWPIVCSSPARSRGAFRYHASFASRTVCLLTSPGGNAGGAPSLARGSNANGSPRRAAGRSLSAAKSPLVTIDRPRPRPRARLSDQATV
jgi:hypothetical protein